MTSSTVEIKESEKRATSLYCQKRIHNYVYNYLEMKKALCFNIIDLIFLQLYLFILSLNMQEESSMYLNFSSIEIRRILKPCCVKIPSHTIFQNIDILESIPNM